MTTSYRGEQPSMTSISSLIQRSSNTFSKISTKKCRSPRIAAILLWRGQQDCYSSSSSPESLGQPFNQHNPLIPLLSRIHKIPYLPTHFPIFSWLHKVYQLPCGTNISNYSNEIKVGFKNQRWPSRRQ